jgi:hypothetical protein
VNSISVSPTPCLVQSGRRRWTLTTSSECAISWPIRGGTDESASTVRGAPVAPERDNAPRYVRASGPLLRKRHNGPTLLLPASCEPTDRTVRTGGMARIWVRYAGTLHLPSVPKGAMMMWAARLRSKWSFIRRDFGPVGYRNDATCIMELYR